ncbi:MAG: hypothetical protein ACOYLB_07180 [Phototrophicaceae bacterium]
MKLFHSSRMMLVVLALFAFVGTGFAQDFGLSPEDMQALMSANALSSDFSSLAFDIYLDAEIAGETTSTVTTEGQGLIVVGDDGSFQFQLTMVGAVDDLVYDMEVRVVDDQFYVRGITPDGAWVIGTPEDTEALLESQGMPLDMEALSSGDLSGLGLDDSSMGAIMSALSSVDPATLIAMSKETTDEGDAFVIELLVNDFINSPAFIEIIAAALVATEGITIEEATVSAEQTAGLMVGILAETEFAITQWVNAEGMVDETNVYVSVPVGGVTADFSVVFTEYNPAATVEAPEGAISFDEAFPQ